MECFGRFVIYTLLVMPGLASLASLFLWAFFGFVWWVPPDGNKDRALVIAIFHLGMVVFSIAVPLAVFTEGSLEKRR